MTRRERREAEKLAKEAADAPQDANGAGEAESLPAAQEQETQAAPAEPQAPAWAPPQPVQPPVAPRQAPVAPQQVLPPPPAHPPQAEPASAAEHSAPPAAAPDEEASTAESSAEAVDPADFEVPSFATRGERKRFLREHDLPSDIPTASIPLVLAERAGQKDSAGAAADAAEPASGHDTAGQDSAGQDSAGPDTAGPDTGASLPEVAAPEAPITVPDGGPSASGEAPAQSSATGEDAVDTAQAEPAEDTTEPAEAATAWGPGPAAPADGGNADGPAGDASVNAETERVSAQPEADGRMEAEQPAQAEPGAGAASGRSSLFGVQSAFSQHERPLADLAQRRIDSSQSGPDFATSSTAVISPADMQDSELPMRRRSPVVQPPTGGNIRVVTGALPITPDPADGLADPPTTPIDAIEIADEPTGSGTVQQGPARAEGRQRLSAGAEQWRGMGIDGLPDDADDAEDAELSSPPVGPMSARSVTHEDGEILVGERGSMVPYIALGAAGVLALALVVIALFLLL